MRSYRRDGFRKSLHYREVREDANVDVECASVPSSRSVLIIDERDLRCRESEALINSCVTVTTSTCHVVQAADRPFRRPNQERRPAVNQQPPRWTWLFQRICSSLATRIICAFPSTRSASNGQWAGRSSMLPGKKSQLIHSSLLPIFILISTSNIWKNTIKRFLNFSILQ